MNFEWRWAALKNGFQDAMAYRLEFLLQVLGQAAVPVCVQLILWYALFTVGGATEVGGMSYQALIHYTILSAIFSQVRGGDHDFDLQELIRSGQLSQYLLRPVGVVEFVYIRGVSSKIFIAGLCFIVGLALSPLLHFSPLRMCGAMLLALMGNVIHYQLGAVLSASAFIWEEAYSILMVKNMVVGLLCGETIPLNLFPASMQWVWKVTPFYFYVYGPVQYVLGRWSHGELFYQMGLASVWMIVGFALIQVSWRLGIRRYVSLGL